MHQPGPKHQETSNGHEQELNILILGETGVGKATFINAFANYLKFETLDQSFNAETLHWNVPHSFTIQYIDDSIPNGLFGLKEIRIGLKDDQHDSDSQHSDAHIIDIRIPGTTIHLLDTPSIGDVRGIEQDRRNIALILSSLMRFNELHGILILLKPNQCQLKDRFRLYIREFLTHLHKDAAKNIAFGLTNTRVLNYIPGDTIGPLKEMLVEFKKADLGLSKSTLYCFDSGSFRFLAASKSGINIGHVADFRESWEHSANEVRRLLHHFSSLKPHLVEMSTNMNQSRKSTMQLAEPVFDVKVSFDNLMQMRDFVRELSDKRQRGDELRKHLQVQKVQLVPYNLEKPRMVCSNVSCIEIQEDGNGFVRVIYKTVCQDPCYLREAPVNVIGCPQATECEIFCRNLCKKCGHHWREHLHITYELQEKMVSVIDSSVEMQLKSIMTKIDFMQDRINVLQRIIDETRHKHKSAVQCALSLKESITPYGEMNFEYLDYLLEQELEEAGILKSSGERASILAHYRWSYRENMKNIVASDALHNG